MDSLNNDALESEIKRFGTEIFNYSDQNPASKLTKEFYHSWLLDWSMKNPKFKVQLFRFIDVLPTLKNSSDVVKHAQEYFSSVSEALPKAIKAGLFVSSGKLGASVAAPLIRNQVEAVANQFIAGENVESASKQLIKLQQDGYASICCFLGDAVVSKEESLHYVEKYKKLISNLTSTFQKSSSLDNLKTHSNFSSRSKVHVSVKLSTLYSQIRPLNHERTVKILSERFSEIASIAKQNDAFLFIDMEEAGFISPTLETLKSVLSKDEFKHWDGLGIVLQAYAKRTEADLEDIIEFSKVRGAPISIRLVKGAYWDSETLIAKQHGWENPLFENKSSSDFVFESLSKKLLDNCDHVYPAFGSHNIRSLSAAVAYANLKNIPKSKYELQFLYGMAQAIKDAFKQQDFLVRDYVPIGELIPGMGYLVRRLLENTSNEGFLRQKFHENESPETLLTAPQYAERTTESTAQNTIPSEEFTSAPMRDYSIEANRLAIAEELERQRKSFEQVPESISPIIGHKKWKKGESFSSTSPNDLKLTIAQGSLATEECIEEVFKLFEKGKSAWSKVKFHERAELLFEVARTLDSKREEFIATLCIETGKTVEESDGEVTEAIDFLNYYGLQAISLTSEDSLISFPGELNTPHWEARGNTLVIGPWNFPLAIPCGMFASALVTGNCCILKPAEQASLVSHKLYKLFIDCGLPKNVSAFLPGRGETLGNALVEDSRIATIAFTGSKEVGLSIIRKSAATSRNQEHVKKVIAEMGGKNSVIVDSNCDLDEAVEGTLRSAFGFQGQKCSACSKVIVVGKEKYEEFASRLKEAMASMPLGPSWFPENYAGPVIDKEQQERISKIIDAGKLTATVLLEHPAQDDSLKNGHFIKPIIFVDVPEGDPLLNKEIFGPVLILTSVNTFEEAILLANDSEYGLTGAVFSRSPNNIELAKEALQVGNLYINRKCTGALVGRQPFGGAKMSGIGIKAGGPDYLKQFLNQKCCSENTMRRGFVPDQE